MSAETTQQTCIVYICNGYTSCIQRSAQAVSMSTLEGVREVREQLSAQQLHIIRVNQARVIQEIAVKTEARHWQIQIYKC